MSGLRSRFGWMVASLTLVWLTGQASGAALQQLPERDRQILLRDFSDARALYMTAGRQAESLAPFAAVAARIEGSLLYLNDLELRQTAARTRAYRAHTLLNQGGRTAEVTAELLALARVDAAFTLDQDAFPQALQDLWETIKRDNVGALVFAVPPGSIVTVDGIRLPAATSEYRILRGAHRVVVSFSGTERRFDRTVTPGQRERVEVTQTVPPPVRTVTPQRPTRPRNPNEPPRRRVFAHVSFPMMVYGAPTEVAFTQTVNGAVSTFHVSRTPDVFLGHYELGAAGRISGALAVGVTYTSTERPIRGLMSGAVRSPTSAVMRSFFDANADVREQEKDYHVEVRGQVGGRSGEAAFFIGPSFIEISRDRAPSTVTVRELGAGAFAVTLLPVPSSERHVGLNLGADFSGFPHSPVGVGGGIRYVFSTTSDRNGVEREKRQAVVATIGIRFRF